MNLFVITWILILFHCNYTYGLASEELDGVDVLAELKVKVPACNISRFVQTDNDFNKLKTDLQNYCTVSASTKQYRLLCTMLLYELQRACALSGEKAPSAAKYITSVSAEQVCMIRNMLNTSRWIWNRITNDGKKRIDVTSTDLCSKVTSPTETLQLARFFYKIAPRVRAADSQVAEASSNTVPSNSNSNASTESLAVGKKSNNDSLTNETQANKERSQQSVEMNSKQNDQRTSETKDNAIPIGNKPKGKSDDVEETKNDQSVDAMKNKTGQAVENIKADADRMVDSTKNKTYQVVDNTKNNTGTTSTDSKDNTTRVFKDKKDNVEPNIDDAKNTVTKNNESRKDKVGQAMDVSNEKLSINLNASSNLDNTTAQVNLGNDKKIGEPVLSKTTDAVKLSDDAVKEASTKTDQNLEQFLDLKRDNKTDLQTKTNITSSDDNKDDEGDDGSKSKAPQDTQQNQQIPKPDLATKKDGEKDDSKIPESLEKTKDVEETNINKVADADNEVDKKNNQATVNDDDDGIKKDNDNNGPDENDTDKIADEEAEKQLKNQQEESDKNDYRTVIGNKEKTGSNKSPTRLEIKKPVGQEGNRFDKFPESNIKDPSFDTSITRIKSPSEKYSDDDGWSGSFVTYFLLFTLFVVVGYLILHNKNKLLAYVVEGRRAGTSRTGSRPSHRGYEKLKNVNDIIPIDDTQPIPDKEAIILKA